MARVYRTDAVAALEGWFWRVMESEKRMASKMPDGASTRERNMKARRAS